MKEAQKESFQNDFVNTLLRNVQACLRANRMTKEHLVKLTIYLTDARHVEEMRAARSKGFRSQIC